MPHTYTIHHSHVELQQIQPDKVVANRINGTPLDDDAIKFINKLDQFGSFRLLYTSAYKVVEEDAPGRHQLL